MLGRVTPGHSDLSVRPIGLGCMGMSQSYGAADDHASMATIHSALDLGVDFLDTSDVYGASAASGGTVTLSASTATMSEHSNRFGSPMAANSANDSMPVVVAFAEPEANETPLSAGPQRHSRILLDRLKSLDIDTDT